MLPVAPLDTANLPAWHFVQYMTSLAVGPNTKDDDEAAAWFGIGLNVLGCSIGCLGWLMQKLAHMQQEEAAKAKGMMTGSETGSDPASPKKAATEGDEEKARGCSKFCPSFFSDPLWCMGLTIFIGGQIITAVSLGLAPQSIVSTLNCFTIIITFGVAPCFLGESVIVWRLVCVFWMCCGCFVVMVNGPHSYIEYTVETLRYSLSQPMTEIAIFTIVSGSVGSWLYMSRRGDGPTCAQYCFYAAATSWFSVLTTKVFMSLLWSMILEGASDQLKYPEFWVALALVACLAPSNVYLMNMALQKGEATLVVPMYDAMAMTGQIVLGGFFFQEFEEMDPDQLVSFTIGVLIVVSGVYAISQDPPKDMEFFHVKVVEGSEKKKDESKAPLKKHMAREPSESSSQVPAVAAGGAEA